MRLNESWVAFQKIRATHRGDAHGRRNRQVGQVALNVYDAAVAVLFVEIQRIKTDKVHSVKDAVIVIAAEFLTIIPCLKIIGHAQAHLEMQMRATAGDRVARASAHDADGLAARHA